MKGKRATTQNWGRKTKNEICLRFTNIGILFRKIRFSMNDKNISNVYHTNTKHTHKKSHMYHRFERDNHYPTIGLQGTDNMSTKLNDGLHECALVCVCCVCVCVCACTKNFNDRKSFIILLKQFTKWAAYKLMTIFRVFFFSFCLFASASVVVGCVCVVWVFFTLPFVRFLYFVFVFTNNWFFVIRFRSVIGRAFDTHTLESVLHRTLAHSFALFWITRNDSAHIFFWLSLPLSLSACALLLPFVLCCGFFVVCAPINKVNENQRRLNGIWSHQNSTRKRWNCLKFIANLWHNRNERRQEKLLSIHWLRFTRIDIVVIEIE